MKTRWIPALVVVSSFLLLSASAWAQSSITGVVRDGSGAVLPGVTVEAASPALIEKVRSTVTDDQGRYRIVDQPNSLFEPRLQQVDLRFSRIFQFGARKLRGDVDIYNLLNASNVLNMNTTYSAPGGVWQSRAGKGG